MLLPGAGLVISLFIVLLYLTIAIGCGCLFGILIHQTVPSLIRKTKAAKRYWSGAKVAYRWYFQDSNWFKVGFYIGVMISWYTLAGPVWTLLTRLKGV